MKGIVPARIPAHKARKEKLHSHLGECIFLTRGEILPSYQKTVRSMFQNPNPDFYNRGVRF